jgi:hypothetical protein
MFLIKAYVLNQTLVPYQRKLSNHRTEKLRAKLSEKHGQQILFIKQTPAGADLQSVPAAPANFEH